MKSLIMVMRLVKEHESDERRKIKYKRIKLAGWSLGKLEYSLSFSFLTGCHFLLQFKVNI